MIESEADIKRGLAALSLLDERLIPVITAAGPVPLRRSEPGLPGLVGTILAQQVSTASARAIFGRLERLVDLNDARALADASDETLREAGLSRPKQRTLRAIAAAIVEGRLDFDRLERMNADEAIAQMVAIHGIGPWTAECHLLFALGHEDVFPAGDLALQIAAAEALALPERPSEKALRRIADGWRPHRAVAARLLWAYYHALTSRTAEPVAPLPAGGKPGRDDDAASHKASQRRHDERR